MSNFNADVRKAIIDDVERALIGRDKTGALESETDFIMGACAVMRVINMKLYGANEEESMDCIPPIWLMWVMSHRSIVDALKDKQ